MSAYGDLKNEKDIQEYLTNLYTEYTFGCCSEKKPEVCHLLGDYEEGIKNDAAKAFEIYKNNCDEFNYGRSCAKYAGYLYHGRASEKDEKQAYKYFKKSCDNNDGIGCAHFGMLSTNPLFLKQLQDGKDDKEKFAEGLEALKKGCYTLKQERACFHLGSLFIGGVDNFLERNYKEGYKSMLISCEYANPFACANVSQMHAKGHGAQKSEELAKEFKERAVDLYNQIKGNKKGVTFQQGS